MSRARLREVRALNRIGSWIEEFQDAGSGEEALDVAWRFLRAEWARVAAERPEAADRFARDLARWVMMYAAAMHRGKPPQQRAGLTDEEVEKIRGQYRLRGGTRQ